MQTYKSEGERDRYALSGKMGMQTLGCDDDETSPQDFSDNIDMLLERLSILEDMLEEESASRINKDVLP